MRARPTAKDIFPVALLTLLAALCAATFLFAPVSVTQDGYSHLYNAVALRWMLTGQPAAHSAFTYNSWLIPNSASAFILAGLSAILPASIALRVLILLIGAAFIASLYFCVDTRESGAGRRAQVLIVLIALSLNAFLTLGFYNFLLSTALCFVILGFELNYGAGMPLRVEIATAILLLVAWFAHPLPLALTFLFPVAMLVGEAIECRELRWRRYLRHLWPWALPFGLMAWFYLRLRTVKAAVPEASLAQRILMRLKLLGRSELSAISPSGSSALLFIFLLIVLLAAVVAAIRGPVIRSRRVSALLLLSIVTLLLFIAVPEGVGNTSAIPPRVLLLSLLFVVVLAFSKGVVNPVMATIATAVSTLIIAAFVWEYLVASQQIAPAARQIDAAMETLPPHARILIAAYHIAPGCEGPALLERSVPERHWAIAGAIQRELIVLNDYEGHSSDFPLKYTDGSALSLDNEVRTNVVDNTPAWTTALNGSPLADYIIAWGTSHGSASACPATEPPPFEALLKNRYRLILSEDGASHVEIWKSR